MRVVFPPRLLTGCALAFTISLSACSKAADTADTPEALLVGSWTQSAPLTLQDSGINISMTDGFVTYAADGSSNGGMSMNLEGLPENISKFDIKSNATWRIEDGFLIENMVTANVSSIGGSPQGDMMASEMEAAMQSDVEARSEILSLTKDELVVYQAETDLTMKYKR